MGATVDASESWPASWDILEIQNFQKQLVGGISQTSSL